jgi:microcystin-dependent protein
MSYQVKFTETTNPAKPTITVQDQTLNSSTSLTFVGKNYSGYAPIMAENFLHLLENFAKNTAPNNPVQGQLWYDNSADVNLLKIYDGTRWTSAGSIKKSTTQPASALAGDLWADTTNQQLYLYSGSNWLLVGPQFSSGTKTGPSVETIVDTVNTSHSVLTLYANNNRLAIISKEAFTPKASLAGYVNIGQGLNLSSVDADSSSAPTKFWGTASTSDALNVGGVAVDAANFLRSDIASTTNASFSIRSNSGLSVGSDLSFNISTTPTSSILYSKNNGSSIELQLNNAGVSVTGVHVSSNGYVGVGPDNTNPQQALDVAGSITVDDGIIVLGTTDSSGLSTGSIKTAGGLAVTKKSTFGDDITTYGQTYVNYLDNDGNPTPASILQPGSDAGAGIYDIGTSTRPFRNVYANTFVGAFNGAFTGSLAGNISGSASKLASPTTFQLLGDVSSDIVSFDGQTPQTGYAAGIIKFTTSINQNIITAKTVVTDSIATDSLLVYRSGVDSGLKQMTKQTFLSNVATVPIGVIMPFAGTVVPNGYLLCDGSEVSIGAYSQLFAVIGYTYKPVGLLGNNSFALPDLRGRFPLGRDNMDNGLTIPSQSDPSILLDAGGGSKNRVTSTYADNLGQGTGDEEATLSIANLPDHQHNLRSDTAQYYAAGIPGAVTDGSAVAGLGLPDSSTGQGLPNSGGVLASQTGNAFSIMNPYMTINYIIFTGVLE